LIVEVDLIVEGCSERFDGDGDPMQPRALSPGCGRCKGVFEDV
jgi:hypothetical protein